MSEKIGQAGSGRYNFIQGLRGFAVIAVVLFHLELFELGFVGVDAFFVISGFVVFGSISRAISQDRFSLRAFWKKRFLRLFPALSVTVTLTIAISFFLWNFIAREITNKTGFFSLMGLSNVYTQLATSDYFAPSAKSNGLLHTWSLSIEAQFYFFFPLLVILGGITGLRRKPLLFFGLIGFSSAVLFWLGSFFGDALPIGASLLGYYSPLPRVWQFLLGAIVYILVSRSNGNKPVRKNSLIQLLLLVTLPAVLILGADYLNREVASSLITFLTAGLLFYFGINRNSFILDSQLLGYVGDRSYSIYLIHWPVILFVNTLYPKELFYFPLVVVLTLSLAHISHKFLEKPFMGADEITPSDRKARRLMFFLALLTIIPFVTLASWSQPKFESDEVFIEAMRLPSSYSLGCHDSQNECTSSVLEKDTVKENASTFLGVNQRVVLIGDSNAAQYFDGIIAASSNLELQFKAMMAEGCPSFQIDGQIMRKSCEEYRLNVSSFLRSTPPSTVFVGYSTHYLDRLSGARSWQDSEERLQTHLLELTEMGHQIVIIEPLPKLAEFDLASLSVVDMNEAIHVPITQSRTDHLGLQHPQQLLGNAEFASRPVSTFRPWSKVCIESGCTIFNGDYFNFQDPNHLTVRFSEENIAIFQDFLVEKLR